MQRNRNMEENVAFLTFAKKGDLGITKKLQRYNSYCYNCKGFNMLSFSVVSKPEIEKILWKQSETAFVEITPYHHRFSQSNESSE